jgi:Uma2 family endonuclease
VIVATDLKSNEVVNPAGLISDSEVVDLDERFELFRNWIHSKLSPKLGKFSFLNGDLEAEMSPESLFDHNFIKSAIGGAFQMISEQSRIGRAYADGALFVNEEFKIVTEPDVMFCLWSTLRENRVEYRPYKNSKKGRVEIHGSPDVIVEVVSNSSVKKDKVRLKQLYFAAGIAEYWLVDARNGRLEFTIFHRGQSEFTPAIQDGEGYCFSKVFNLSFWLERYADPLGTDDFRLRSK